MPALLRRTAGIIAVLILLAAMGPRLAISALERRYPAPGRMVDVGGHKLHLYCTGEGSPAVVLESGLGTSWVGWSLVQPAIARFARACVYDRAGYGWSEAGPMPRTAGRSASELAMLLERTMDGPCVLVAHSFGAFCARLLASRRPQAVAGIVLVDSAMETAGDAAAASHEAPRWRSILPSSADRQRLGRMWRGRGALPERARQAPPPFQDRFIFFSPARQLEAESSELQSMGETIAELRASGGLKDTPLTVLTAGESASGFARLSSRGKEILARGSGHFIQLDQPQLVIDAARELVLAARNR